MKTGLKQALPLAVSVAVLLAAVLVCLLLYRHDNKYTYAGPRARQGILLLQEGLSVSDPVVFLVDGWAFYADRLLTPADLGPDAPVPDEYLFIGQYGGFDRRNNAATPHGCATYRLRIRLPEEPRQYMLELSEIFSAYRLYINGREAACMGVPEKERYRPATGNRTVTFGASGSVDLLVAVSDYTHFYSGMVYPPAFGNPDEVSALLEARLVFRSILCAAAGVVGILAVLIGILSHRGLSVRYGLLCLCFIGYAGYPVWRRFTSWYGPLYALENLCFCAALLLVLSIQCTLRGRKWKYRWGLPLLIFGGLMLVFTVYVHITLGRGSLFMMTAYSGLIAAYQWMAAGFLTITSLAAVWRRDAGSWSILCGIMLLDTALVMDRLLPLFEPIVGGWFVELAVFALVACIGLATGGDMALQYRRGAVLIERARSAEQLLEMQRVYHEELARHAEETRLIRHDLRHHVAAMDGMLRDGQYAGLRAYLAEFGGSIPTDGPGQYCEHPVANIIADYYHRLAKNRGIALVLQLGIGAELFLADTELGCILSNLLENAMEACMRLPENGKPRIALRAKSDNAQFALHMENSAAGERRSGGSLLSAKGNDRMGYGLRSVQAVVERYQGEAEFRFVQEQGLFVSTVLLQSPVKNP